MLWFELPALGQKNFLLSFLSIEIYNRLNGRITDCSASSANPKNAAGDSTTEVQANSSFALHWLLGRLTIHVDNGLHAIAIGT